jgi:hypothetical protein
MEVDWKHARRKLERNWKETGRKMEGKWYKSGCDGPFKLLAS